MERTARRAIKRPAPDTPKDSPTASLASTPSRLDKSPSTGPDSCDRKKQTHLRCERQRREAINNGYQELKDLIPTTSASLGCKTTNASVLFRACDYMVQLQGETEAAVDEQTKLEQQLAALQLIAQQYESMSTMQTTAATTSTQSLMLQVLLDDSFRSFCESVNTTDYTSITRSLLPWVETLGDFEFQRTLDAMASVPYNQQAQGSQQPQSSRRR